jgi:hypothetical protein
MTQVRRAKASAATSTSAIAAKTSEAADTLMAWLQTQPGWRAPPSPGANKHTREAREASEPLAAPAVGLGLALAAAGSALAPVPLAPVPLAPIPRAAAGRDPAPGGEPLRLSHTDWLHHRLLITGPDADLAALRTAAAGAGTVPWQLDFDRVEEDLFHLLAVPPAAAGALHAPARSLSLMGARILAGQLCEAAARRHVLATSQIGHSRACPFDLHALIPVPDVILRRGPDDPAALAWLWTHWGTTQTLRQVAVDEATGTVLQARASEHAREGSERAAARPKVPPMRQHRWKGPKLARDAREGAPGEAVWVLTFWSADWTPWRALAQLAANWPTLRFTARPTYDAP